MTLLPPSPTTEVRHLACIGLMGAGKSTIGHLVADRLGWGFVDVDEIIEARTRCTVEQLWEHGGEEAYRPLEREVVLETLQSEERSVLATPGGVVLDLDATRAIAADDVVAVYLRADPATLGRRIEQDPHLRPLVEDHPETTMRTLFTARDHCYERLADHVIQVDGLGPQQVAQAVVDLLDAR